MGNTVTSGEEVTNFKAARDRQRHAFRAALLDTAGRLLAQEGPSALSVRRLASEVNASTKVLYTLFGGKDGLAEALYLEGFARLARALEQVPITTDATADILALGHAYFENALRHPHLYRVMFLGALPEYRPAPNVLAGVWPTFDTLIAAVERARQEDLLCTDAPREVALALWSIVHGVTNLHLTGHLPRADHARAVLDHTARGYLTSLLTP